MKLTSENSWLLVILLAALILRLLFAFNTPNWQAPDEYPHYFVIKHLAVTGEYPISNPKFPYYEAYQPPLYYFIGAGIYLLVKHLDSPSPDLFQEFDPDTLTTPKNPVLIILRLFSVLLGMLTILIIYKTAFLVFNIETKSALLVLAMVSTLPTFIVNNASVTNDALANLVGAIIIWQIFLPETSKRNILIGVLLGLGILTKANLYPLSLLIVFSVLIQKRNMMETIKSVYPIFLIASALSLWFFIWNYTRYGSIIAISPGVSKILSIDEITLVDLWQTVRNINWSFWAAAGRIYQINLSPVFYLLIFLPVTLVALLGVIKTLLIRTYTTISSNNFNIIFFAGTLMMLSSSYFSLMSVEHSSWGKYVYPSLSFFIILLIYGVYQIVGRTKSLIIFSSLAGIQIIISFYLLYQLIQFS
ncbi:MAG: glycosyltransferase family 39 protein [Bacteroidota bacterium]|nr:glycosyltransferase family 39 protein [Bacteroidota bacterium]